MCLENSCLQYNIFKTRSDIKVKFSTFHEIISTSLIAYYLIPGFNDLTLSRWRSVSYRNQSIDLLCKSVGWFLYDISLRHERLTSTRADGQTGERTDKRNNTGINERTYPVMWVGPISKTFFYLLIYQGFPQW